ncbi:unsaturated rhamnogalacturonyl hydrolase YteR [Abditibacteriota bacterium]|nr:unsaturated rhamnogalacturonyl hydrolase YteR [Abditibacteriota bacterium]
MKIRSTTVVAIHLAVGILGFANAGCAQQVTPPTAPSAAPPLSAAAILEQSQQISEAQLKILSDQKRNPTDWVGGTLWAGVAEFSHVSNRPLEAQAIVQMGEKVQWQTINHTKTPFHADDDCIGQTFLDAYAQRREARFLEPLQKDMDALVEHLNVPADEKTKLTWWWCDALFMAPAVLARMSNVTGDSKYIDAMDKEWWRVAGQLYDPQEHLYYRDARFLKMTTKNGKKVFWSRGNGWVFAGLARVLTWMPKNYPTRPKYEQTFQAMAAKLLSIQGKDGAWRTSLLDAEEFPEPETSGTAFYCYGMAWGVNEGLLPRATYAPAATKAWTWLLENKRPDGVPGRVQKVGDRPGATNAQDTQLYATGAMLMAGTELMKLAASGPPLS